MQGRAGAGGASGEAEFFRGKQTKKEFHFVRRGHQGRGRREREPVVYSFETSRIKEPLFAFLEQHG